MHAFDSPLGDPTSRRRFLGTGLAVAGAATFPTGQTASAGLPSDELRLGIVGCGGQGRHLTNALLTRSDVALVAVCDVDRGRSSGLADTIESAQHRLPRTHSDHREMLDAGDLDAVVVATPDHWHAHVALTACAAGCDVYLESPMAHSVAEIDAIVAAVGKTGRIVQIGCQGRSQSHIRKAADLLAAGEIGKVTQTRSWAVANELPGLAGGLPTNAPADVDYERWLGPAPLRPFHIDRFHRHWRWFFDYGSGLMGARNLHWQDCVDAVLPRGLARSVFACGGKLAVADQRDTPDTLEVAFDYGDSQHIATLRSTNAYCFGGPAEGASFHGTEGTLRLDPAGLTIHREPSGRLVHAEPTKGPGHAEHLANFLACVKTRVEPAASPRRARAAAVQTHLGNIAFQLRRVVVWEGNGPVLSDGKPDRQVQERLTRPYRSGYELPVV